MSDHTCTPCLRRDHSECTGLALSLSDDLVVLCDCADMTFGCSKEGQ